MPIKNMQELKTRLFVSLGTASMCWSERPSGVFDDELAVKIGDKLYSEISEFFSKTADEFKAIQESYQKLLDESQKEIIKLKFNK